MRGQPDYDSVELALHDLEEEKEDIEITKAYDKRMKSPEMEINEPESSFWHPHDSVERALHRKK